MNARQAAAMHAGFHAGLHAAATIGVYVAAAYIVLAAAWFAWICCRHPHRVTGGEAGSIRDALTAELAEAELQDMLRRGQL